MSRSNAQRGQVQLDLSDVDPRVGQVVGGGQLWEPCSATDIRRWVHAMDYPNPIHWDQEFARRSSFGGVVAPQSFVVCMDYGLRHSRNQFRGPAFEGDVTYLDGEVVAKTVHSPFGTPTVTIQVKMTNQDGGMLADAALEVELPE